MAASPDLGPGFVISGPRAEVLRNSLKMLRIFWPKLTLYQHFAPRLPDG